MKGVTNVAMNDILRQLTRLLDFSFNDVVTPKVVRMLYPLALVLHALSCLALVVNAFNQGAFAGLGAIVVAPVFFLVGALFVRITLEFILVIFRGVEYLRVLAEDARSRRKGGDY